MEPTKIQARREAQGLSRAELHRRSGVPVRTLEAWEGRFNLPRDVYQLLKVARALDCLIEDLITPEDAE